MSMYLLLEFLFEVMETKQSTWNEFNFYCVVTVNVCMFSEDIVTLKNVGSKVYISNCLLTYNSLWENIR